MTRIVWKDNMPILPRIIAYFHRRKAIKQRQVVLSRCVKEIRQSYENIKAEIGALKRKFSQSGMVQTICITAYEIKKMEKALNSLKKEGF